MTAPIEDALRRGAQAILGKPLTTPQTEAFLKYLELLVKWQRVQRLVGSPDPASMVENLLLDSLLFTRVLPETMTRIMDLGSGAGLPGVPLCIVLPGTQVTLVEAKQKRASFLATVIRELGLHTATVVNCRAEALPSAIERSFDAVVMRCAGPLGDMLPLAARFVAPGGLVVASGPPSKEALPEGEWRNIARPNRGGDRLFAVLSR